MSISSIILLSVLAIVIGYVVFKLYGPNTLFLRIDKNYSEFEKNRQSFDQTKLLKLRDDVEKAIYQLSYTIPNREKFIENNSDLEYSEYAGDIGEVENSVREDKARLSRYQGILAEVDREYNRREHASKYE